MADTNKLLRDFETFFKKMSYDEREAYLKEMGFSFGTSASSHRNPKRTGVTVRRCAKASYVASIRYTDSKKNKTSTIQAGVQTRKKA